MNERDGAADKLEYDRIRTRVYIYIGAHMDLEEEKRGLRMDLSTEERFKVEAKIGAAELYFEAVKAALGVGS